MLFRSGHHQITRRDHWTWRLSLVPAPSAHLRALARFMSQSQSCLFLCDTHSGGVFTAGFCSHRRSCLRGEAVLVTLLLEADVGVIFHPSQFSHLTLPMDWCRNHSPLAEQTETERVRTEGGLSTFFRMGVCVCVTNSDKLHLSFSNHCDLDENWSSFSAW